jgi:hypothetical protein
MALDPITAVTELGSTLINKFFPDADASQKRGLEMFLATFTAQAGIINTEAASQHWLAANWRPLLMLTFGALIVARWFGWAAPNLSEAEYLKLWSIVELGIGGYVVGRSVEKVAPAIAASLKKN